jgi:hypothetical protein
MGEAGPEVATSLVGKPLRRGSALLFPTEVRGDIQYQLVKEFMPLSMALAIADDRAALPTDLSTLANANLCHGGTSHSCDRFNPGCRPSLASGVEVALLDGAEHEQAPLACRSVGPSHLGVRVIDPCCHDGDHACDHPPLGRPVGFVALRLYADGQTGEIYMLTVDPLVQRQGDRHGVDVLRGAAVT